MLEPRLFLREVGGRRATGVTEATGQRDSSALRDLLTAPELLLMMTHSRSWLASVPLHSSLHTACPHPCHWHCRLLAIWAPVVASRGTSVSGCDYNQCVRTIQTRLHRETTWTGPVPGSIYTSALETWSSQPNSTQLCKPPGFCLGQCYRPYTRLGTKPSRLLEATADPKLFSSVEQH